MATISTTFTDATGTPETGYIEFTPRQIRRATLTVAATITPKPVRIPLDPTGLCAAELEPGDYNIAIVIQGARTVYTTGTIPPGAASIDLRTILGDYMPETTEASGTWGPGQFEFAIPAAAKAIDYVLLGAGGGGSDGVTVTAGPGGGAGTWLTGTLTRGQNIPATTQVITGWVPGASGKGQAGGSANISFIGQATSIVAGGGAASCNFGMFLGQRMAVHHGLGVTPITFNGYNFAGGGAQTTPGGHGIGPGGGGAGGLLLAPGAGGAEGRIWLRAY